MPTPGKRVIRSSGKLGVRSSGKSSVFDLVNKGGLYYDDTGACASCCDLLWTFRDLYLGGPPYVCREYNNADSVPNCPWTVSDGGKTLTLGFTDQTKRDNYISTFYSSWIVFKTEPLGGKNFIRISGTGKIDVAKMPRVKIQYDPETSFTSWLGGYIGDADADGVRALIDEDSTYGYPDPIEDRYWVHRYSPTNGLVIRTLGAFTFNDGEWLEFKIKVLKLPES